MVNRGGGGFKTHPDISKSLTAFFSIIYHDNCSQFTPVQSQINVQSLNERTENIVAVNFKATTAKTIINVMWLQQWL